MQTVAAGKCQNGILRYWMSVGRGDFDLSAKNCTEALLYASLVEENVLEEGAPDGVKVHSPLFSLHTFNWISSFVDWELLFLKIPLPRACA